MSPDRPPLHVDDAGLVQHQRRTDRCDPGERKQCGKDDQGRAETQDWGTTVVLPRPTC